jgi:hypothetical protein
VGYRGKWQDLINITRKTFNTSTGKWELNELYEGRKIYLPSFKFKWAVNDFRAEIHREIPIMQDKSGTTAWFELPKLVEESIRDERREGYLQERRKKPEDEIRLHWGGDAAQYFRGIKTTRVGYPLPDAAKVVQNDPRQYRSVLQFEGKDDYASHKEYLVPMFPLMDGYTKEGIQADSTHYSVKQSQVEAETMYFWRRRVGIAGIHPTTGAFSAMPKKRTSAPSSQTLVGGKCRCGTYREYWSNVQQPPTGRSKWGLRKNVPTVLPLSQTKQLWMLSLPLQPKLPRPLMLQPTREFGLAHHLSSISLSQRSICASSTAFSDSLPSPYRGLLRAGLDTVAKVDAMNASLRALKMSCKKVGLRKKTAAPIKDTESINFIGR